MPNNHYELTEPVILPKPSDISEDDVAYNPSAIWTTEDKVGRSHDIMYVRVEPDHSMSDSSFVGKSRIRPYEINVDNLNEPLKPYSEADEQIGKDPALTLVNRRLGSGAIERVWLLSCVDSQPFPFKPNEIRTQRTKFYVGKKLDRMEHIADGPIWMENIRISEDLNDTTALHVYGRPLQKLSGSGNITYTKIDGIQDLDEEAITAAQYINEGLFPKWGSSWGGVNDVIPIDAERNLLLAYRARKDDALHYEAVLFEHNFKGNRITDLGVLATANAFPSGHIKNDKQNDSSDVVFPGGGYNGNLGIVSFGLRNSAGGVGNVQKLP